MRTLHKFVAVAAAGLFGVLTTATSALAQESLPDRLLTEAERSDYTATARYDKVVEHCIALSAASKFVHVAHMGKTVEGREIPMMVVSDPLIKTPEEAARSGKLVVLLIGGIHAGEVEGKEALPMLVRDIVSADEEGTDDEKSLRSILDDLILLVVPLYNADGNENIGPIAQKRPGQNGPTGGDGVGTRENAQGFDLNRDYVKLESPEARALVGVMRRWDPAVFVDTHTTNGSHHRYVLTYMGPTNPAGDSRIVEFVRDKLLPEVGKKVEERTGYKSFFYGNLEGENRASSDYTKWTTYPDQPRYGGPYVGFRNRISILTEAYTYAPYKDRVLSTKEFCRASLEYVAANKDDIRRMIREADESQRRLEGSDLPIRTEARAFENKVTVLGYVEEQRDGRKVATERTKDYSVELINNFVPTVTVKRPFAYLYPRELAKVTENLQHHGIEVDELREDIELDVETYIIESVTKAMRPFQKHDLVDVNASASTKSIRVPAGTMVVRTAQKLGTLAAFLLEPRSSDGLTTWNFFDDALKLGEQFPVMRVASSTHMLTTRTRPLADDREMNKKITYETLYGGGGRGGGGGSGGINISGSPLGGFRWLDDGEHYTLTRDGKVTKINALTGRVAGENAGELFDRKPLVDSLLKLPTFSESTAKSLGNASFLNTDPQRKGALFSYENDLYYGAIDGSGARRLTSTPEAEEDVSWSPDGNFVAFTRSYDLYVVDVATANERRLTTGGHETLRNGKNDWVYFEELYGRSWRAYWWSPDSKRIAFLQVDSSKVPIWSLAVDHQEGQRLEQERYPRPGDPNPSAKFGVVTVAGGNVRWADLSDYDDGNFLITWAGWLSPRAKPGEEAAESRTAFLCVQNRTQTWMDIIVMPTQGSQRKLLRETTEAWVEPQGDPYVLKDGSFILASERDGYRHLYLYDAAGKLKNRITEGKWEARSIAHVDEEAGIVYFNAHGERTWTGSNLYRVKLDGTEMKLLTTAPVGPVGNPPLGARADAVGSHSVSFSPNGKYYIDTWSDSQTPTRVALYDNNAALLRTLDTNPVYAIEEYTRGELERVKIPMKDGFELEGTILKPPGFSEGNKYPVWLMTYAGPHAPTVSDTWGGGRTYDEMLANTGSGIIVFRVDPRSASGKGAVSAWSAYKQLGVPELADLEAAVAWLAERPYIDASRVGIAGGSYGGFMTSYALTHSKTFSAGIATASVTDWRDYDSIYTERYMLTPQENPEGYEKTSVVKAAREGKLHGRLLLVHGTMDDNVHMANSIKLVSALQQAPGGGSQFDFMLYPGARHGVGGEHVRDMNFNFIREQMLGEKPAAAPTGEEPSSEQRPRRGGRTGRRGQASDRR